MPFGFCDRDDVAAILSEYGMASFVDDDEDYEADIFELQVVDTMIERAAFQMIFYLDRRYTRDHLSGNIWCKWVNATWAALYTATRRGMPAAESLKEDVDFFKEQLKLVCTAQFRVPEVAEMFDITPSVSNYDVERRRIVMPVRVTKLISTTKSPPASRMRWISNEYYGAYT